jgi:hypothetical protein
MRYYVYPRAESRGGFDGFDLDVSEESRVSYADFIHRKLTTIQPSGFAVAELAGPMFPHQVALTRWALKRGRAAIFADTGLGKSRMASLIEWVLAFGSEHEVRWTDPAAIAWQHMRNAA